ncbi:MAG: hypothetical protein KKA84_04080 [Bacteroidetes bacterium]|nr:hypothetical protein [Bacteroidota bacterium]
MLENNDSFYFYWLFDSIAFDKSHPVHPPHLFLGDAEFASPTFKLLAK